MSVPAGQLNHYITFQVRETGQDAAGGPTTTWDTFASVWAKVVQASGSEDFKGQQLSPEVTHRVKIRWLDGLTALHRISFTDDSGNIRVLDILAVNYSERKIDDEVMMLCKERIDWQAGN